MKNITEIMCQKSAYFKRLSSYQNLTEKTKYIFKMFFYKLCV